MQGEPRWERTSRNGNDIVVDMSNDISRVNRLLYGGHLNLDIGS